MFADYNGKTYIIRESDKGMVLETREKYKADKDFEENGKVYQKVIQGDDYLLESIYDLHFSVSYRDNEESGWMWRIDEGEACHRIPDLSKDEVGIRIYHESIGKTWVGIGKNISSKIIKLEDCVGYYVERDYYYRNKKYYEVPKSDVKKVEKEELKKIMVNMRVENVWWEPDNGSHFFSEKLSEK